jgi:hypothetical protein
MNRLDLLIRGGIRQERGATLKIDPVTASTVSSTVSQI